MKKADDKTWAVRANRNKKIIAQNLTAKQAWFQADRMNAEMTWVRGRDEQRPYEPVRINLTGTADTLKRGSAEGGKMRTELIVSEDICDQCDGTGRHWKWGEPCPTKKRRIISAEYVGGDEGEAFCHHDMLVAWPEVAEFAAAATRIGIDPLPVLQGRFCNVQFQVRIEDVECGDQ
jgi:hypothetical protein